MSYPDDLAAEVRALLRTLKNQQQAKYLLQDVQDFLNFHQDKLISDLQLEERLAEVVARANDLIEEEGFKPDYSIDEIREKSRDLTLDHARLLELASKYEEEMDDEEYEEYSRLKDIREKARLDSLPWPTCCEAIRRYPAIVLELPDPEGDSQKEPHWQASLSEHMLRKCEIYYAPEESSPKDYYDLMPIAKFCPYCGQPLPKVKLKDKIPDSVGNWEDGNHCSSCGERCMSCKCDWPQAAYEIVQESNS
jgi:hypothetical protein